MDRSGPPVSGEDGPHLRRNLEKGEPSKSSGRVVKRWRNAAKWPRKHGILLALENHGGMHRDPEQLLVLVKP